MSDKEIVEESNLLNYLLPGRSIISFYFVIIFM